MEDLIKALTILAKYCDKANKWPTHCEHDVLMVRVDREVSEEDQAALSDLSFSWDEDLEVFQSYRFGSG